MQPIRTLGVDDYLRAGTALREKRRLPAAIACYERAVELAPDNSSARYLLGNALLQDKRYLAAEQELRRTIDLDPAFHAPVHDLGLLRLERGDLDGALRWFDQAINLSTVGNESRLDRALCLLMRGDWAEGFEEYESRTAFLPSLYPDDGIPRWEGEPVNMLRVVAEQGAGDIIQFSRFLWTAAPFCDELIFVVNQEMMDLFKDHPCVDVLAPKTDKLPAADATIPLCSLARLADIAVDRCPQDPGWFIERGVAAGVAVEECEWKPLKIGLCWAGNPGHGHDHERSIALDYFVPLMGRRSRQFYSFQVGQRANDIALAGAQPLLFDLAPRLTSWSATAGHLLAMDLVITVDTALAHLAASMNIKTWLLVGSTPDWRWLTSGERTPWYPTMRIFRQPVPGDWRLAIMLVGEALDRLNT